MSGPLADPDTFAGGAPHELLAEAREHGEMEFGSFFVQLVAAGDKVAMYSTRSS